MQRLEVSGAVRPLYGSLGIKGLNEGVRSHFFAFWRDIYKVKSCFGNGVCTSSSKFHRLNLEACQS